MTIVYLAIGSNQGDRLANLQAGLAALAPAVQLTNYSSVYETAAAYVEDQPPFLNAVVAGTTELAPHALLALLKQIEHDCGRRPGLRYGPRPLDLDILLYGELELQTNDLIIPHLRMFERDFVLRPLAEIAPNQVNAEQLAQATQGSVLAVVYSAKQLQGR
ncbi:MAG TPA: 2-amino-4-hydroxy-6-hydroxymethyldihydropteridine diphosphokinase [Herpetosiphon sp.]|uniref:2-amino-4-hydroxy-6-hydroxymethyldihydropteridine diphosphokinase n=1 Tax=Herpetosiphon aurantiacus (strain ATCC 23779 / DSM 785 / 114-95) TaxID=316274 RepID=A9AVT5_HERA2|nr:2-amino-4-hydroxy-6-hydroxymethyldihydropteridine diphosphokinase [Herpetosiphon sp.]ABX06685.1 2-amino-4-hydroxy-6-hydroxymethyldihydropteridine pyrophosphokinase [Herpetosiphon aurantiacus DSM 785]HBW52237.1 2-amino-4-hydroxy-6-hydroxymethyldihydropteridine diphosphokinase [Herpetosiphon sp.]